MTTIGIIIGSTRPKRIGHEIASWLKQTGEQASDIKLELIDLVDINLPFLDEPEQPAKGGYVHAHTKAWSQLISSYDGFVIVTPQYNWGYPAPLKNALDFLYREWAGKPVVVVSYGKRGGGRAMLQLQSVLQGLHMRNTRTNPQISFSDDELAPDGHFADLNGSLVKYAGEFAKALAELQELLANPTAAGPKPKFSLPSFNIRRK